LAGGLIAFSSLFTVGCDVLGDPAVFQHALNQINDSSQGSSYGGSGTSWGSSQGASGSDWSQTAATSVSASSEDNEQESSPSQPAPQPAAPAPIMIYAIVQQKVCGNFSAVELQTVMTDERNSSQASRDLVAKLKSRYPDANWIQTGGSGKNAVNVAALQWQEGSGDCLRNIIIVEFGARAGHAMDKAVQRAPKSKPHQILKNEYFPHVTSR
jgi:hypothetical protein